jgi:hypothetical protein
VHTGHEEPPWMSLNQQVIAEFSPCTPSAPQLRDLSIQTYRFLDELAIEDAVGTFVGRLVKNSGQLWSVSTVLL